MLSIVEGLRPLSARPLAPLLIALAFASLPGWARAERAPEAPIVVLISLDGTRPADLGLEGLPTFAALARSGASAARMIPVFPSNTFPNHVSLVTGVKPERHGIVSNVFEDPERGKFSYENDPSWIEAEPLWSILDRHGISSAAYHWVGSEGPWRNGRGPRSWVHFKSGVSERRKVEQILAWLDEPAAQAPGFISAWFRGADSKGHRFGPDSKETAKALRKQDGALGELVEGITQRGLWGRLTLILVSDHGMARVERDVDLGAELSKREIRAKLYGGGGISIIEVKEGQRAAAREVIESLGLSVWYRDTAEGAKLPLDNPRFASGVVMAPPGLAIFRPRFGLKHPAALISGDPSMRGAHGHDPALPEMAAIFLARGRQVPAGLDLGIVSALDVTPTVLDLFGVPVPERLSGRRLLEARAERDPSPSSGKNHE